MKLFEQFGIDLSLCGGRHGCSYYHFIYSASGYNDQGCKYQKKIQDFYGWREWKESGKGDIR